MAYYSPNIIAKAKQIDLLTYLQNTNPDELVHFSRNTYTTRTHDSLKISNGKWYWFSRGFGGKNALDYLIKVEGYTFLQAVEHLTEQTNDYIYIPKRSEKEKVDRLILPKKSSNNQNAKSYLMKRGISENIIQECIDNGLIYEDLDKHNVVFIGYDDNKNPRYAGMRSTNNLRFMQDAPGSDKTYSFRLEANENTDSIHLFESAIDLLSYATLLEKNSIEWSKQTLISLAGVYQPAKQIEESKVPLAVNYYLNKNPNIKKVFIHFDNDIAGKTATLALQTVLPKQYEVIDKPPPRGKDFNDYLCLFFNSRSKKIDNAR